MYFNFSPSIEALYPDLEDQICQIIEASQFIDVFVPRDLFLVCARVHPDDNYSGCSHGWEVSKIHYGALTGETIAHPNGRIDLLLPANESITTEELIRLVAHELRHLAQYQEGYLTYGVLSTPNPQNAETDARAFEEQVLDYMIRYKK